MRTRIRKITRVGGSAAIVALASVAVAQNTGGPDSQTQVTARFISELEANDNYNLTSPSLGNALIWTNTLGAGLTSSTATDQVLLDVQGSLRLSDLPVTGSDARLDDPRIRLNWAREVDDNNLEFDLRYRYVSIAFFDPLRDINPDGSFDDTRGDGDRETTRLNFDGIINDDGPVSFEFGANYNRRRYYNTTDPSLFDRDLAIGRGEFGFDLSPRFRATIGGSFRSDVQDDERQTDRETRQADVGFDADINDRMEARFRVGYSIVDTKRLPGFDQGTEEGWVGSFDLVADRQTGEARFNIDTTIDENGPRSRATLGGTFEFPRGELDTDIGASVSENTQLRPVGFINYLYRFPRGEFNLNASQIATIDEQSRDVVNSNLGLSYLHNISRLSSLDLSFLGGLQRYENAARPDRDRVTIEARYNRRLTRDWGMDLGYRYRLTDSDSQRRAQSNAVFFNLRRDFAALR